MSEFRKLFEDFGKLLGIPNLEMTSDGYCRLNLENDLSIQLLFMEDEERAILFCELGQVPADRQTETYEELLSGNFMWHDTGGATLSLHRPSQTVVTAISIDVVQLETSTFHSLFATFSTQAVTWKEKMQEILSAKGDKDSMGRGDLGLLQRFSKA